MPRDPAIDHAKESLTATARDIARSMGKNPLHAEIYFTLFFSHEPLGIKEIAEKTGYSTATINQNMGLITTFIDVRQFKKPGSKKLYFECTHDPEKILLANHQLFLLILQNIQRMIRALKNAEEQIKKTPSEDAQSHLQHIKELRQTYEKAEAVYTDLADRKKHQWH